MRVTYWLTTKGRMILEWWDCIFARVWIPRSEHSAWAYVTHLIDNYGIEMNRGTIGCVSLSGKTQPWERCSFPVLSVFLSPSPLCTSFLVSVQKRKSAVPQAPHTSLMKELLCAHRLCSCSQRWSFVYPADISYT